MFMGETLSRLETCVSEQALDTPVQLTEYLSDQTFAAHAETTNPHIPRVILVNTRWRLDPEEFLHAMIEETVHAQQALDGVDTAAQKAAYPYQERPYEKEAKQRASDILGYTPEIHSASRIRPEPEGFLFDRRLDVSAQEHRLGYALNPRCF
jgi:hypothetical protein